MAKFVIGVYKNSASIEKPEIPQLELCIQWYDYNTVGLDLERFVVDHSIGEINYSKFRKGYEESGNI